ncbi:MULTISPECIES: hypothetical protein [Massilia]|uniref:Uncharacterized protein n=1 Tax=Massilia haematophila TaxID=457923 RepID=A0ABV7PHV5_9BURK|nr:hypothetical protein [Massilia sp.]
MFIRALLCLLAASSSAYAGSSRTVPEFEVHAKLEKKNALVNFDRGAVAAVIDKDALDSIAGTTSDFPDGPVPAYIVFDESVPEERLFQLANFQGRLKGSARCKRIRLGSSPLFPELKSAVLAEQCTIKSLNH